MENKVRRIFIVLSAFFLTNALLAEFIGVKIFSLEKSFGFSPVNWQLFGIPDLSFNLTAGVLLWPFVFILTDIVNEYFGKKGVRLISFLAAGMIVYAFAMVLLAIHVSPADFWIWRNVSADPATKINMQTAFNAVFGQGLWIIAGSLTAFLVGQVLDVYVFHFLRKFTGSRLIWLRATGSTLVSQLIDSYVVLFIAFYFTGIFSFQQVMAIGMMNYVYKVFMAIGMTPLLYVIHWLIEKYLGKENAHKLAERAARQ